MLRQGKQPPQARHRKSVDIFFMRVFTVDLTSAGASRSTAPEWADAADTVQRIERPSELSWSCVDLQPDAVVITVEAAGTYDTLVTRTLRADGIHTPVFVLAHEADGEAVAKTLEAGADDVVPTPVSVVEMRARLRALTRRPATWEPDELSNGPLRVDLMGHRALAHDRELDLTPVQFRLLTVLVRNAGRTLTRDQLLESVWDPAEQLESNVVDQAVSGLRTKLAEHDTKNCLKTVRGVGYRLEAAEEAAQRPTRAA